jgi:hypothetical protein
MRRNLFPLLLNLCFFFFPSFVRADIRELGVCGQFNAAERVVIARVEQVRPSELKKREIGELEFQQVTFSVLETLKTTNGQRALQSANSLSFTVAPKFGWLCPSPMIFKSGEDYVLFLRQNKNEYRPVTEWEGALSASRRNRIHIQQCEIESRLHGLMGLIRRYLDGVKIDITNSEIEQFVSLLADHDREVQIIAINLLVQVQQRTERFA